MFAGGLGRPLLQKNEAKANSVAYAQRCRTWLETMSARAFLGRRISNCRPLVGQEEARAPQSPGRVIRLEQTYADIGAKFVHAYRRMLMKITLHCVARLNGDFVGHRAASAFNHRAAHVLFGSAGIDDLASHIACHPDFVDLDFAPRRRSALRPRRNILGAKTGRPRRCRYPSVIASCPIPISPPPASTRLAPGPGLELPKMRPPSRWDCWRR